VADCNIIYFPTSVNCFLVVCLFFHKRPIATFFISQHCNVSWVCVYICLQVANCTMYFSYFLRLVGVDICLLSGQLYDLVSPILHVPWVSTFVLKWPIAPFTSPFFHVPWVFTLPYLQESSIPNMNQTSTLQPKSSFKEHNSTRFSRSGVFAMCFRLYVRHTCIFAHVHLSLAVHILSVASLPLYGNIVLCSSATIQNNLLHPPSLYVFGYLS
jgi:hypothetical protein